MAQTDLDHLDRLSTRLDSQFRFPGTSLKFGWDTVLGILPGVGDAATAIPATYLLYKGYQLGARKRTVARMAVNTGVDLTIGAIPLLGDVFDLYFKSNNRNIALLRQDLERKV